MTKDEIKQMDEQGLAAWDKHDANAFVGMFADNFTWYDWTMPQPIRDKAAARQYFEGWMAAIPDMKTTVVSRVIGDDLSRPRSRSPAPIPARWLWAESLCRRPIRRSSGGAATCLASAAARSSSTDPIRTSPAL